MLDKRKQTGQHGEDAAAMYLTERGYSIVQRNWRCTVGELDIVAEADNTLVFVEVRTKRSRNFGTAVESITPTKQAKLVELAETYLQETNILNQDWRIDVIAIWLEAGLPHINHIENAVGW